MGHAARLEEAGNKYKMFGNKFIGKTSLGRPRYN